MSGYSMGRQTAAEPGTPVSDEEAFRPFWDTYHTINERYAGGEVDRDALVQGAIRGMIESLEDPYSSYLTSDEYRESLQGISGEFEGIGAEIATEASDGTQGCATLGADCRLVIVAPLDGSPAEAGGLLAGDLILAVDGVPLDGLERGRRARSDPRAQGVGRRAHGPARRRRAVRRRTHPRCHPLAGGRVRDLRGRRCRLRPVERLLRPRRHRPGNGGAGARGCRPNASSSWTCAATPAGT